MKIRPVGAELFHTEGRTDMMKLMGEFRSYQSTPMYEFNTVRLLGDTQCDSWLSTLSCE